MSKIEELIQQYCPDGVEYIALNELLDYEQPTKYIVNGNKYDDNNPIPVLTAGKSFVLGYTDEEFGIYKASKTNPTIIFDDFTTSFHWVEFDFKVKSSAMKMLRPKNNDFSFRYLYYAMCCIGFVASDHVRHWISQYSHFEIPLPPLPVQEEIAKILDTFTDLQAELQAELQARRQQYQYYRDKLLSFEGRDDVEWKKLGEICSVLRGKRLTKSQLSPNGKFKVFHGGIDPIGFYDHGNREANTTMVINVGASAGTVGFSKEEFWSSDGCFCLSHSPKQYSRFVYYYLQTKEKYLMSRVRRAGIPTLDGKVLEEQTIPVPPLSVQEEIVATLDKFNTLVNDLSQGLPAEIEARKRQYEYYRDKLLTFKKKA